MFRLAVLVLVPACAAVPELAAPDDRGDVTITTWADGAVTAGVWVSVHDAAGQIRARVASGPDGQLVTAIEPGWSATVVDDRAGFRHVDTALGLAPGDDVAIGQRRRLGGDAPPLRIAPLAPVDGALRYTITVCGPVTTTTPVDDPDRETVPISDRRALDAGGGALIVAEAHVPGASRFALIDADDVAKLPTPVILPAWQDLATSPVFVAADPDAIEVGVSLRSRHGCVVGAGVAATSGEVAVGRYPGLPIDTAAATTWFARGDRQGSWTSRRIAGESDALVAEVPVRVADVAVQPYGDGTVLGWTEDGDPLAGDHVVIVAGPTYDAQWTLVMPRGHRSVILPRLDELPAGAPQWVNVSIVDLADDGSGWTATGTLTNPVE